MLPRISSPLFSICFVLLRWHTRPSALWWILSGIVQWRVAGSVLALKRWLCLPGSLLLSWRRKGYIRTRLRREVARRIATLRRVLLFCRGNLLLRRISWRKTLGASLSRVALHRSLWIAWRRLLLLLLLLRIAARWRLSTKRTLRVPVNTR